MQVFVLLLVLHMVVVGALVAGRALHARLGPLAVPAVPAVVEAGLGDGFPGRLPAVPTGRSLEDYVQAGLLDLRIMLVQAARHRDP